MKNVFGFLLALIIFLHVATHAFAASTYVLPYPGIMPGNKLYIISQVVEKFKGVFAFGDFAKFKYNLSESDKYLVEAKTLFEYNQYPLALSALQKSDIYFQKTFPNLLSAQKNGKNISDKKVLFESAKQKHIEVLKKIESEVPSRFTWRDEKKNPVDLNLKQALENSIQIRLHE